MGGDSFANIRLTVGRRETVLLAKAEESGVVTRRGEARMVIGEATLEVAWRGGRGCC